MYGDSSNNTLEVENDFYYSVLNLPKSASQSDITERHRALSLIFHPDRQHEEGSKSTATKKFLEIQKAYEVLSDPFFREVYDVLGEQGLNMAQSAQFRSVPREEAKKVLAQLKGEIASDALRGKDVDRGSLICGVDAVSLFSPYVGSQTDTWTQRLRNRCEDVGLLTFGVRHVAQRSINNDQTHISGKAQMSMENRKLANTLIGTVRHQFSPRFASEISIWLIPHSFRFTGIYNEAGTAISASISTPIRFQHPDPSIKIAVSRQLFRRRLETASFEVDIGRRPHFALNLLFPKLFGTDSVDLSRGPNNSRPPSTSGLKSGTTHTLVGLSFVSIIPRLVAEWGVNLFEIGLKVKVSIEVGLTGPSWKFSGKWALSARTALTVATELQAAGVVFRLEGGHEGHEISIPILLSNEFSPGIALFSVVLPSTAFMIGYHTVLKPRRRQRRLDSIRAARHALEDEGTLQREREIVTGLLKESARKSKNSETSKDGLIIAEATWGATENDEGSKDLVIDVTIPLQALVRSSQLYIPAERVKSGIRGFSDPAPLARKRLCIRYLFRRQTHYAEIPEGLPVVLPLAEHVVE